MYEWNSVVVSSFGWWSHHVGAPESNGMCLIQTFTLQTTIVGLPSSDIGVIHSFTYFICIWMHPLILMHHLPFFRESTKLAGQRSLCTPERDPDCWGRAVPWERDRASSPPPAHEPTCRASGTVQHCAGSQHVLQDPSRCRASGRLLYFWMYHEWTDSVLLSSHQIS